MPPTAPRVTGGTSALTGGSADIAGEMRGTNYDVPLHIGEFRDSGLVLSAIDRQFCRFAPPGMMAEREFPIRLVVGALAPNIEFLEPDQADATCPVLLPKINRFAIC